MDGNGDMKGENMTSVAKLTVIEKDKSPSFKICDVSVGETFVMGDKTYAITDVKKTEIQTREGFCDKKVEITAEIKEN